MEFQWDDWVKSRKAKLRNQRKKPKRDKGMGGVKERERMNKGAMVADE